MSLFRRLRHSRAAWLGLGLVSGLVVCLGLVWVGATLFSGAGSSDGWPGIPLHAVATDRTDTFAMATGPVDEEVEAVYFLDFYTGDLKAAVISKQKASFQAYFTHNVNQDLGVDPAKNPRYLLVTGMANFRQMGGRSPWSKSVVYVAEITSGKVAAYVIPWVPTMHAGFKGEMKCVDVCRFRAVAAGAGIGTGKGKPGG